jgi:hypothetical protein
MECAPVLLREEKTNSNEQQQNYIEIQYKQSKNNKSPPITMVTKEGSIIRDKVTI